MHTTADNNPEVPRVHAGPRTRTICGWIAIIAWSIIFFATCARVLVVKHETHSVYLDFTGGGHHWLNSESLYARGSEHEFRYSPLVAALFVPFDLLPPRIGEFLWRTINFAVFIGGLFYCCRVALPRKLLASEAASIFLLVIPLSVGSLNNAQSNPLLIGLLLIAVAAVMKNRWTLAALAVVIATYFKLYPIAVGLLLVLLYPKRFTWRLLVGLAVGALLPFLLQSASYVIDQYASWSHYLMTEDRQGGPIADWYRDLRAAWRVYIGHMSARQYLHVELAVAAGIAGILLLGAWRRWPRNILLTFLLALACTWMTPLGPATESATYILLAPAIAWMLVLSYGDPDARPWRIAYGIVFGMFVVCQAALWFGPHGKWFRDRLQPLPVTGVLFLLVLMADAVRRLIATARTLPTSQNV
jgi:hypothetical protein